MLNIEMVYFIIGLKLQQHNNNLYVYNGFF